MEVSCQLRLIMDNGPVRKIVNLLELLIRISYPLDDDNRIKILRCIVPYRKVLKILRKRVDYTENAHEDFQENIDKWFQDLVDVFGAGPEVFLSSAHKSRWRIF